MGAIGISCLVLNEFTNCLQRIFAGGSHIGKGDCPVGPNNTNLAVDQFQICNSGFQFVGGNFDAYDEMAREAFDAARKEGRKSSSS